jgi:repressor LexA
MTKPTLTRRQQEIYDYLAGHYQHFDQPPTLEELCHALGMRSRGSLHKHIQALVDAGLVEPMHGKQRGIRLTTKAMDHLAGGIPFLGYIAAGRPIEIPETVDIPVWLRINKPCYVVQVIGDSMIEDGIFDGDRIVIEQRNYADSGEIVVALIDGADATLKRIEQKPSMVILHPANSTMQAQSYEPDRVTIQGVLVGLIRSY